MTSANDPGSDEASGQSRSIERFAPIRRSPSLSDEVADALLRQIREGPMVEGQRFPSERELSDQFNVSRTVVREAIRSLAAKGVLMVRPGQGLSVARVQASAVRETMGLYLRGIDELDYAVIHEVRVAIEPEIAGLAASRATGDDIETLTEVCRKVSERPDDIEFTSGADLEFHTSLASVTHNPLFTILFDSIGDVLLEIRMETLAIPGLPGKAQGAHEEILSEVAAGNSDGARLAMRRHLTESEDLWRSLGHGVAVGSQFDTSKK